MKIAGYAALVIATLSLSLLLFLTFTIAPTYYINTETVPFFDIKNNHPVIINPAVQYTNILGALISPIIAALLAYFINEQKKSILTYLPIIVMYLLYVVLLYLRLSGKIML